ncbi:MAG: diaminopimelate epimerase [bacterium]|nr:diaminopimelate epimerase [bacterium]MDO5461989.1 diaminopimelate epimerase [bacterium]
MTTLHFTKMHGAANDFIMIDDREGLVPWEDYVLMSLLATRRTGVGSEGIILIQQSKRADFRMRFLNPDGTEVDMCGNGARCAAWFAHHIGAAPKSMTMETSCGLLDAEIVDECNVKVWMPEPSARSYGMVIHVGDERYEGDYVNTGVPHFVIRTTSPETIDIDEVGRAIRLHPAFAPEGVNVNFIAQRAPNRISMRTYERGVEAESGACGTGAVAAAITAVEAHAATLPMTIRTSGGFVLNIDSDWRANHCTGITLTGPVRKVYEGTIDLSILANDLAAIE